MGYFPQCVYVAGDNGVIWRLFRSGRSRISVIVVAVVIVVVVLVGSSSSSSTSKVCL